MSWRPVPFWGGSWGPAGQCKSISSDTNANVLAVEWSARCLLSVGKITLWRCLSVADGRSLDGQFRLGFQLLAGEMNLTL